MMDSLRRGLLAAAFLSAIGIAGCTTTAQAPAGARESLAPTGVLRIGVYPGSPTSLVAQAPESEMRGVTVDIGRLLAQRLGVPAKVVVYPRVAEVVAAIQRGDADFTITNATAERQQLVDFANPLVDLELGVIVLPPSKVATTEGMDQAGATIGVSQGSSSERTLGARFKQAKLRTYPSLDAARAGLQSREIDGFATNKAVLFEQAQRLPGAQVLPGRWGVEHLAPATQKGRAAGLAYLREFTKEVRAGSEVAKAADRAGLRGTAAP